MAMAVSQATLGMHLLSSSSSQERFTTTSNLCVRGFPRSLVLRSPLPRRRLAGRVLCAVVDDGASQDSDDDDDAAKQQISSLESAAAAVDSGVSTVLPFRLTAMG